MQNAMRSQISGCVSMKRLSISIVPSVVRIFPLKMCLNANDGWYIDTMNDKAQIERQEKV